MPIGNGVLKPATTSSPWAFIRYSPYNSFFPVEGNLVKATPVPDFSFKFPNSIVWIVAPVPSVVSLITIGYPTDNPGKLACFRVNSSASGWPLVPVVVVIPVMIPEKPWIFVAPDTNSTLLTASVLPIPATAMNPIETGES